MTIASEITKLNTNLTAAYTAVSGKGGTLPQAQNFDNLATAISSIPSGSAGIPREVSAQGVYQMPTETFTFSLPNNVIDVGSYGLNNAFRNCTGLTSADLSSLTTVSGNSGLSYAFQSCTSLTSIDLSSLTTVSGSSGLSNAFRNCTGLTSVSFPALTTTSFGSYKNQFQNMMNNTGTSRTHTLHFPSNMQSTISGLTGYPTFGGTSGYVVLAFDLPATS